MTFRGPRGSEMGPFLLSLFFIYYLRSFDQSTKKSRFFGKFFYKLNFFSFHIMHLCFLWGLFLGIAFHIGTKFEHQLWPLLQPSVFWLFSGIQIPKVSSSRWRYTINEHNRQTFEKSSCKCKGTKSELNGEFLV